MKKTFLTLGLSTLLVSSALTMANAAPDAFFLQRWLRIHNESSQPVCAVYINHIDTTAWGRNHIYPSCIQPGRDRLVDPGFLLGYCRVDIKLVTQAGDEWEEDDVNICEQEDYYIYDD